jgi:hypothetical protein
MDITTLAAWGEFLGGIAVVVSLVYLASQIRMNTKTVRASSLGEQLTGASEWNRMIVDPDAASLYVRGLEDFVGLSAEDQVRFNGLMGNLIGQSLRVRYLRQQGLYDASAEAEDEHTVSCILESPGARQWWAANRHWWQAEFGEWVDAVIRETEAAG